MVILDNIKQSNYNIPISKGAVSRCQAELGTILVKNRCTNFFFFSYTGLQY